MTKNILLPVLRKLLFVFLFVVSCLLVTVPAIADTPKHYTELEFPELPEVAFPDYKRFELANGMVVYLVEDRDLPLVSGSAILRTGSRLEPPEKVGLASITGSLMRNGGTQKHSATELNQILEADAASIETSIGTSAGRAGFSTLTEDFDQVLELFAEVLQEPVFDPQRFELTIKQSKGAIARRNDDPQDIANREFDKLIYGDTSPYGRTVEVATLDNISRDDVVTFYQTYIRPENMILGLVGDFDTAQMQAKIEQTFGSWQVATPQPNLEIPTATQASPGGTYLIERPESTQSSVAIGHLGGTLNNPDYPALSVMNGLLNGFGGRLFNEVRSRKGLAYSVYGLWNPNSDYPGQFTAGGQTQTATTVPFIQSVLGEIKKIQTEPISESELTSAKESILNSFVFNFQDPSQSLSRLLRYEYFGYPADFIFQYQAGVKATTVADVQRVAQKYLKPEQIVTLVVGKSAAMNPPLRDLGEVKVISSS